MSLLREVLEGTTKRGLQISLGITLFLAATQAVILVAGGREWYRWLLFIGLILSVLYEEHKLRRDYS